MSFVWDHGLTSNMITCLFHRLNLKIMPFVCSFVCRSNMICFFFINIQPWLYRRSYFIGKHPSWASVCCNDQYPWWYHSSVFESIHPFWLAVCFIDNLPWTNLSIGFRDVHATWSVACFIDNNQWSYHSIGYSLKNPSWSVVGFIVSQPWIQPSFVFFGFTGFLIDRLFKI